MVVHKTRGFALRLMFLVILIVGICDLHAAVAQRNAVSSERCRRILDRSKCQSTVGCVFDDVQTKRCFGVNGKACKFFKGQSACDANYGCRWTTSLRRHHWISTCKPFGFHLPARSSRLTFPPKGPFACGLIKKFKACRKYSGCRPTVRGCRIQRVLLRHSFYFLDGCTQNYGLNSCNNLTRLPFKNVFMERLNGSWYFMDRVQVLVPVSLRADQTIHPSNLVARVQVAYAHDQTKTRTFVYDIMRRETGSSSNITILRFEQVGTRKICRQDTGFPVPEKLFSLIESLLQTSPSTIVTTFVSDFNGSQQEIPTEETRAHFGISLGNNQAASAMSTGPKFVIRSFTSDLIADSLARFDAFNSLDNCAPSSDVEEAAVPSLVRRQDIELKNVSGGGSGQGSGTTDFCFASCLELQETPSKRACVNDCALANANGTTPPLNRSFGHPEAPNVLTPDMLSWESDLQIRTRILTNFETDIAQTIENLQNTFGDICGNAAPAPNIAATIALAEDLIRNVDKLEMELLRPIDLTLGKAFTLISLVRRISDLISSLDAQLADLALILELMSQIPITQPIVAPLFNIFKEIRTNLITAIKNKLSAVAGALQSIQDPVLKVLLFNEDVRKLLALASAGVESYVVRPMKIADCNVPLDAVARQVLDSFILQKANSVVNGASSGLESIRDIVRKLSRILENVETTAIDAVLKGLRKLKDFWDATIGKVLYPLQVALDYRVRFDIPWLCESPTRVCAPLPCGTKTCSSSVWCGVSCRGWHCRSRYCTIDYPCGVVFCESCATVTLWLPCLKPVSFTVREILVGASHLLAGPLDIAMTVIKPILNAIPKPSLNLPGLPSTDVIPLSINSVVADLRGEVTDRIQSGLSNLIIVELPIEIQCGAALFLQGSLPVPFWQCPPWSLIPQGLRFEPTGILAISLEWTQNGDMDLMVQTPYGNVISYNNAGPDAFTDGGRLDRDDRTGKGPETIFWYSSAPPIGVFHICVHPFAPLEFSFPVGFTVTIRKEGFPVRVITGQRVGAIQQSPVLTGNCSPDTESWVGSVEFP